MKQYRVEHTLYPSDREPCAVMCFETIELGNTDILCYLEQNHLKNNSQLRNLALEIITDLNVRGETLHNVATFYNNKRQKTPHL